MAEAGLRLEARGDGVVVPVRAKAAARKNAIAGVHDGALRVSVTAPPEKGKANAAIAELLAGAVGVAKSHVQLVSGPTSPQKRFFIEGKTAEETLAALRSALA